MKRPSDEHDFRRQVGRRLHQRRTWLRLAQQDVADKAGVTRNFVSAIERGTQSLDAWRLRLVADTLGVTLDWLLFGPDDQVTNPEPGSRRHRWHPPTTDTTPPADPADGPA